LIPGPGIGQVRRGRRGSTFIVVLAILSLLVLVATALSLTSRLEVIGAANYAEGVQSRMAAKTGLSIAAARAVLEPPGSTNSASDAAPLSVQAIHPDLANAGVVDLRALAVTQSVSLSQVWTLDSSARINLNTADADTLARLFQAVKEAARVNDGDPRALANAIIDRRERETSTPTPDIRILTEKLAVARRNQERYAPASEPQAEPDPVLRDLPTPDLRGPDLRVPPLEGNYRITSLTDLLSLPGASPALVAAASPYLTVFSSSRVDADTPSGKRSLVDLNAADLQEVYEALQALYPDLTREKRLLEQFAANVVDWRDPDHVPTQFPTEDSVDPVLGLERTPLFTEVWPNSIYPEETGGAGQYVELYNPWSDPLDVTGWSLKIGGTRIALRGRIAPAGYLVVTDIFEGLGTDRKVDSPFDSFYSIFGVVGNATTRRILENPELRLPWNEGIHKVELCDSAGHLIDAFTYVVETPLRGQKTSYQRRDPRIRVAMKSACSPFAFPYRVAPFTEPSDPGEERYPADHPFLAATEVMTVFAGWGDALTGEVHAAFPVLALPASPDAQWSQSAADPANLDARLLDLFDVRERVLWQLAQGEEPDPTEGDVADLEDLDALPDVEPELHRRGYRENAASAAARKEAAVERLLRAYPSGSQRRQLEQAVAENDEETLTALACRAFLPLDPDTRLGRVNLNSAPRAVLASLPGMNANVADAWVSERENEHQTRERFFEPVLLFQRPSDLLVNEAFWRADSSPDARYRRLTSLLPAITFSTSSVFMDSRTLVEESSAPRSRQPAVSRALALVAFDRGRTEFVAWSQTP